MAAEQLFNIEFVQEIEKYPCLYNFKMPEYMRKDVTERVWREIGSKFDLTGAECKERWKNLRSVFVRHLKPPKAGSSHKKRYYLSDYMQFTIPFIKIGGKEALVNLTETLQRSADETSLQCEDMNQLQFLSNQPEGESDVHPSTSSHSILGQQLPESPPKYQPRFSHQGYTASRLSRPLIYRKKFDTPEKVISNYFKMKQAKLTGNPERTSNEMFLLSILSDMNKMNDRKRRVFKRRLLELVDEIMEEEEVTVVDSPETQ